jgi:hypothetical protein
LAPKLGDRRVAASPRSLQWRFHGGRVGLGPGFSNLANSGLRDLAVATPDGYVDTAVALAADVERRRALRHGLRDMMRGAPIGDAAGWVRDFEALTVRTLKDGTAVAAGSDGAAAAVVVS